jgi:predicted acyltransferase
LLGVRAGACLRQGQVARLWQFGLLALLAGALWSLALPLNKQLWTSSFVLFSGGVGLLAIALAHQLIDLHGMPAIGKSFGVNAIAAYAGSWIVACVLAGTGWATPLYRDIFAAMLAPQYGAAFASFAFAAVFTGCFAALMCSMDRRGWRIVI